MLDVFFLSKFNVKITNLSHDKCEFNFDVKQCIFKSLIQFSHFVIQVQLHKPGVNSFKAIPLDMNPLDWVVVNRGV